MWNCSLSTDHLVVSQQISKYCHDAVAFEELFAVETQDISGEMSGEEKKTSSAADLARAPGTQGAPTRGHICTETAVPRSRSSVQHKSTGDMICRWHEVIRKMSVSRL